MESYVVLATGPDRNSKPHVHSGHAHYANAVKEAVALAVESTGHFAVAKVMLTTEEVDRKAEARDARVE